jgi:hypothetical protein
MRQQVSSLDVAAAVGSTIRLGRLLNHYWRAA